MTKFAPLFGGLALVATASSAHAEEKSVSYADLNLATAEGQATLERRIASALEEVCQTNAIRTGTRVQSRDARKCMDEARAKSKKQVAAIVAEHKLGG